MKLDKIVIATNNNGKLREFKRLLQGFADKVLCPGDLGVECNPEETGLTFSENALIKARALKELTGLPVLADDSGLIATALMNEPGVYSARYAGEKSTDKANRDKLVYKLQGHSDKSAYFVTALALILNGKEYIFEGISDGLIIDIERGVNGFGYDPVFFSTAINKTFAEASDDEKNSCSHRARAVQSMIARFNND